MTSQSFYRNGHAPLDNGSHHLPTSNQHHQEGNSTTGNQHQPTSFSNGHVPLDTPPVNVDYVHQGLEFDAVLAEYGVDLAPDLPLLGEHVSEIGHAAAIQKFYQGIPTCKCCTNWVERRPMQVPKEMQQKYDGVAIQVYHTEDHSKKTIGSLSTVAPGFIIIQSPVILPFLEPLLKELGSADAVQGKLSLLAPFPELFFTYGDIRKAVEGSQENSKEETHLKVLKEVTDELILETTNDVRTLWPRGLITWQYLWTLFKKGNVVVAKKGGQECLYLVVKYDISSTTVTCRYVGFDGANYGFKHESFQIPYFSGVKHIRDLTVYPVRSHKNLRDLEKSVTVRSFRVLDYQGISYAEYGVPTPEPMDEQKAAVLPLDRIRIIIDPYAYHKFGPGLKAVDRLESTDSAEDERLRQRHETIIVRRPCAQRIEINRQLLKKRRDWLLLLEPFVPGYSLEDQKFRTFYIDHIHTVKWNNEAYEQLVFAETSKDLLRSLVHNHEEMKHVGQDIISGKGNGLVVLLSGPPGTGKTLTAEALADGVRRPLLRVQAETFETYRSELKKKLQDAFHLATEWNALLLIDEADAFLGKPKPTHRSTCDDCGEMPSERSSLVRILMTSLEYYSGILMLTTNFPHNIDEAFASRIDVHFEYPALNRQARCRLLGNIIKFIAASSFSHPIDLSKEDLWELARWKLNGRELKNAAKVSSRLCSIKRESLSKAHLELAIQHTSPAKYKELEENIEDDRDENKTKERPEKRARLS